MCDGVKLDVLIELCAGQGDDKVRIFKFDDSITLQLDHISKRRSTKGICSVPGVACRQVVLHHFDSVLLRQDVWGQELISVWCDGGGCITGLWVCGAVQLHHIAHADVPPHHMGVGGGDVPGDVSKHNLSRIFTHHTADHFERLVVEGVVANV